MDKSILENASYDSFLSLDLAFEKIRQKPPGFLSA